jgi:NAD(P)-dependent dehydrogenase (short-subunit alcohol dehydrogenase family)
MIVNPTAPLNLHSLTKVRRSLSPAAATKRGTLTTELRALGVEAEFLRSDVRHEDEVRSLVDQTVARFGRLDVAVNNAGTEGKPRPVTEQSAESYATSFDTNVLGALLTRHPPDDIEADIADFDGFWQYQFLDTGVPVHQSR